MEEAAGFDPVGSASDLTDFSAVWFIVFYCVKLATIVFGWSQTCRLLLWYRSYREYRSGINAYSELIHDPMYHLFFH